MADDEEDEQKETPTDTASSTERTEDAANDREGCEEKSTTDESDGVDSSQDKYEKLSQSNEDIKGIVQTKNETIEEIYQEVRKANQNSLTHEDIEQAVEEKTPTRVDRLFFTIAGALTASLATVAVFNFGGWTDPWALFIGLLALLAASILSYVGWGISRRIDERIGLSDWIEKWAF